MQLPAEKREARLAGLIVVGLLLFIFEAYLPRPVPWLKFGLANIVTLIALYWMGWKEAVIVSLFRITIGSFFTGNLFTPGFFLSLSGGLSAVFLMGMLYYFKIFSLLTVSIGGSLMHNLAQLIVAAGLLFKNAVVWYLLPYLLLSGVLTGVVTGLFSYFLLRRLIRDFER
jgi:heptaprenyl diphosphate synthase